MNRKKLLLFGFIGIVLLIAVYIAISFIKSSDQQTTNQPVQQQPSSNTEETTPLGAALEAQSVTAEDRTRTVDVQVLVDALRSYQADTGAYPANISRVALEISKEQLDLCSLLVPDYLPELPVDPALAADEAPTTVTDCDTDYTTGYSAQLLQENRFQVFAPSSDGVDQVYIIEQFEQPPDLEP